MKLSHPVKQILDLQVWQTFQKSAPEIRSYNVTGNVTVGEAVEILSDLLDCE